MVLLIAAGIAFWQAELKVKPKIPHVHDAAALPTLSLPSGSVKVNMATEAELQTLHGIGPALSAAIVAERDANGPFFFPEDLINVKGIGVAKAAKIREALDMTLPVTPEPEGDNQ